MEKDLITINRSDLEYIYETCKSLGAKAKENEEKILNLEAKIRGLEKEEDIKPMISTIALLKDKFCSSNIRNKDVV
jgi:hypothetical protein